jgi:concentrative nucleoside transporter, CNT family
MERLISFFGLWAMLALCWLCSENRRRMNGRLIVSGVALQFCLALFLLRSPQGQALFEAVSEGITQIIGFAESGAKGVLGNELFGKIPPQCLLLNLVPSVIFIAALMAVLFHLGIMQLVVKFMARLMVWVMDTSGSESLCAAANVFMGMVEGPLVIRPYLETMTRSELMAMMTSGLACIAGSVMAVYIAMGVSAGHLLAASLMSAPAGLVCAKIMIPETEPSATLGTVKMEVPRLDANVFDAACRGATDGMKLALNIIAGLIAIISIMALLNWPLGAIRDGSGPYSLERFFSWLFTPLAWIMGIEWKDAPAVGAMLGKRLVFNEFIAYIDLVKMKADISPRSFTIATYAMCGFANFGSVAIMISGIGALVPSRRKDLARLGLRALVAGTIASFMTACIAGMLI